VEALNISRRHLTAEQKRDLIAKLLKANPEQSNRTIAKQVKADHKTVGSVRTELEGRGEVPHVETRTDSKGRKQPAKRDALPAQVKLNGQAIKTDDFSPAAQAQIAKALAASVSPSAPTNAEPIEETNKYHREVAKIMQDFAPRFRAWFNATKLADEAKDSLHDVLMLAADELMTLAQEVDGRGAESGTEKVAA
jgi:hypothetical protein